MLLTRKLWEASCGLVHTRAQSFHLIPHCSEKLNTEGLRSDANAWNRKVPFHEMERLKKRYEKRYTIVSFHSRLNTEIENMSTERLRSRVNKKQKWYAIVPFRVNSLFVRSRNSNEDGTERLRSRVNEAYISSLSMLNCQLPFSQSFLDPVLRDNTLITGITPSYKSLNRL